MEDNFIMLEKITRIYDDIIDKIDIYNDMDDEQREEDL